MKHSHFYFHTFIFGLFMLISFGLVAQQSNSSSTDKAIFDKYILYITPYKTNPTNEILEKTASFFLGTPYVAHTLDVNSNEALTVNLRELDCFTYIETVIALTQTVLSEKSDFEEFCNNLQRIRYRNGVITDYSSRLHYTSDWAFENEKRGLLTNCCEKLGGKRETKPIDFMSAHRSAYAQLKTDDVMLQKIIEVENRINQRGGFYYLPKSEIAKKADEIPLLSVIAFTTSIHGLDVTHVGFVWKEAGRTSFIHASSREKKVIVDSESLSDYCLSQKSCIGIMVLPLQLK